MRVDRPGAGWHKRLLRHGIRPLLAAMLGAAALACPSGAAAQQAGIRSQIATEARLQAAYLLKFPSYVEWPGERQPVAGAIVIAVANADDVAEEVRKIAERMAPEARPTVKTVRPGDSLAGVHLLYLGGRGLATLRALGAGSAGAVGLDHQLAHRRARLRQHDQFPPGGRAPALRSLDGIGRRGQAENRRAPAVAGSHRSSHQIKTGHPCSGQ